MQGVDVILKNNANTSNYTADKIQVLEGLEAVRRRPECISAALTAMVCTIL